MTYPLTPYTYQRRPGRPRGSQEARTLRVAWKHDLAVARKGTVVHRIDQAVAALTGERIRYAARWMCGTGSADVVLLASADAHDGMVCPRCQACIRGSFVYRCFAGDGRLLYIGITGRYGVRMSQHASTSPWWPEVADTLREEFPSLTAARAAERRAIEIEHPEHNRQWVTA